MCTMLRTMRLEDAVFRLRWLVGAGYSVQQQVLEFTVGPSHSVPERPRERPHVRCCTWCQVLSVETVAVP